MDFTSSMGKTITDKIKIVLVNSQGNNKKCPKSLNKKM